MKLIPRKPPAGSHFNTGICAPVSERLQKICLARGICSAEALQFSLKQLHPVSALAHVEQAARLLAEALKRKANILIVGDFDADGATATALSVKALRMLGHQQVSYLVPNRFEYGYGLTPEIVAEARRYQPDLIITVDNGISSIAGVQAARQAGIQVLVTDHHLPGNTLPDADVIVNPNLSEDTFPSRALAGVGVIFYVMLALKRHLQQQDYFAQSGIPAPNLLTLLDLVALGTVADVVPLDANNRILVEQGLRRIRAGQGCAGIQALFAVAGRNIRRAIAADFAFACGPRLNAAGRLDDMSLGIECLLSESAKDAHKQAQMLDELNQERRAIEEGMKAEALHELASLKLHEQQHLPDVFCLYNPNWHQGVVGILAARIKEQFNRPVIAFAPADPAQPDGEIKGSARSIAGIHMRDLLDEVATQNPGLLNKFGGHAMAAGLSLQAGQLDRFRHAVQQALAPHIDAGTFQEVLYTDGELQAEDFSLEMADTLRAAVPWGQHCPPPVFDGWFVIRQKKVLKEQHLRLHLLPEKGGKVLTAIAFRAELAQWPEVGESVHLLYRLDVNEYQGLLMPQIVVERLLG